jgi:hypothetical protein
MVLSSVSFSAEAAMAIYMRASRRVVSYVNTSEHQKYATMTQVLQGLYRRSLCLPLAPHRLRFCVMHLD